MVSCCFHRWGVMLAVMNKMIKALQEMNLFVKKFHGESYFLFKVTPERTFLGLFQVNCSTPWLWVAICVIFIQSMYNKVHTPDIDAVIPISYNSLVLFMYVYDIYIINVSQINYTHFPMVFKVLQESSRSWQEALIVAVGVLKTIYYGI